jgi:succinyl-CoA synthetase beta subunit
MDGDIGVISNGAGLALATCDYLAELGAKPLNFAEIGN